MRIPRYTLLDLVIEPLEEECVFLLYIHHLSSLCSHRPSFALILLLLFTPGSSSVTNPARHWSAWPCGCLCPGWSFHNHEWKPVKSSTLWSNVSCSVVIMAVYPTRTQTVLGEKKSNYIANVLHNTMPLFCKKLLVFAKSHIKTPVYTNFIILFDAYMLPCIYKDLRKQCSFQLLAMQKQSDFSLLFLHTFWLTECTRGGVFLMACTGNIYQGRARTHCMVFKWVSTCGKIWLWLFWLCKLKHFGVWSRIISLKTNHLINICSYFLLSPLSSCLSASWRPCLYGYTTWLLH